MAEDDWDKLYKKYGKDTKILPKDVIKGIDKLARMTLIYFALIPLPIIIGISFIWKWNNFGLSILWALIVVPLWLIVPLIVILKKTSEVSKFGTFEIWKHFSIREKFGRILLAVVLLATFFVLFYYVGFMITIIVDVVVSIALYFYNKKRIKEVLPQKKSDYSLALYSASTKSFKNCKYIALIIIAWFIQFFIIFNPTIFIGNMEGFTNLTVQNWNLYNDGTFIMNVKNELPYEVNITSIDLGLRNGKVPCTSIKLNGNDIVQIDRPTNGAATYANGTYELYLTEDFARLPSNQLIQGGEVFTVDAKCNLDLGTYSIINIFGEFIGTYTMQINIKYINVGVAIKEHRMDSWSQGNLFGYVSLMKIDSKGISFPTFDEKNINQCDRDEDCRTLEFGDIGNWSVGCCSSRCDKQSHKCYVGGPDNSSCQWDYMCEENCKCRYIPPAIEVEIRAQNDKCQFNIPEVESSCYDTISAGLSVKYYRDGKLFEEGPYYHNFTISVDLNSSITVTSFSLDSYKWHEWDDFGCSGRSSDNPSSILIDRCKPGSFNKRILVAYYSPI